MKAKFRKLGEICSRKFLWDSPSYQDFTVFLKTSSNLNLRKMVAVLGAVDVIFSIGNLLISFKMTSTFLCQFGSAIMTFGFASSLAWTCCFAHTLNNFLRQEIIGERLTQDIKRYYIITSVFGIFMAILNIWTKNYVIDKDTSFCWHSFNLHAFDWNELFESTLPIVAATVYCMYSYLSVIIKLRSFGLRAYLELLLYPLVLVICFFPAITLGFYIFVSDEDGPFAWRLIAKLLLSCQGLFNAFVYGLSRKIVIAYKNLCCGLNRRTSEREENVYSREEEILIHRQTEGSLGSVILDPSQIR